MKKHEAEQMNEADLVKVAEGNIPKRVVEEPIMAGQRLPEDFVNPPQGAPGHKCLDPQGRYKPDWYSLKIHKASENMPQRQYFNHGGKQWLVEVGRWVDVPPEIITLLRYTEQEIISMDISETSLTVAQGVTKVVDMVPRFSTTSMASA